MSGQESDKLGDLLAQAFEEPFSQPPKLEPIPAFQYAKPSDYEVSITPLDAIASYGYARETAVVQLHRELQVGRASGIAEHAIWQRDGEVHQSYYLIVPTWFWSPQVTLDQDFWQTGYRDRFFPTKGYTFDVDSWIRLFGVRFWFPNLAATRPLSTTTDSDRPSVSRAELEKWHQVFAAVHPDAVEAFALRSAAAMFPDNHIPRQWVRDLRGPRKRGKPAKRHD